VEFTLLSRYKNMAFFKVLRSPSVERSIPIRSRVKSSMKFIAMLSTSIEFRLFPRNWWHDYLLTLEMGWGQKVLTRVGSGNILTAWVGSAFSRSRNFSSKNLIFQFFSCQVIKNLFRLGQKIPWSEPGWSIIYCRSETCLGQVRAHF